MHYISDDRVLRNHWSRYSEGELNQVLVLKIKKKNKKKKKKKTLSKYILNTVLNGILENEKEIPVSKKISSHQS